MSSGSLSDRFSLMAKEIIGRKTVGAITKKLRSAAFEMVSIYANTKDYYDVTGNLLNSFAVGIYHQGKLVDIVDASDVGREPPTRLSLAKGEIYNKAAYYTGEPVAHVMPNGKSVSRPYRGEYGSGGQDGEGAARRSLRQMHPSGTYALVAVVAMRYASFVQNKKGHDVLSGLRDEMPGIFEGKVVTI